MFSVAGGCRFCCGPTKRKSKTNMGKTRTDKGVYKETDINFKKKKEIIKV